MHTTSMENMRRCVEWYGASDGKIVDLGSMNVNGSYQELFAGAEYVGVDLEQGPGVDVVLSDVYHLPFENSSVDLVLSGQMLEHCGQFWRVFNEIYRVLKPEGRAYMIAPSSGPVHRYPVDCYRFYPDSYRALAEWSGLRLVHSWTDQRGPWCDIVGVFQKGGNLERVVAPRPMAVAANSRQRPHQDPAVERQAGARPYLEVLRDLHDLIRPKMYLEIGVRTGSSLALAAGKAIAIDPDPDPDLTVLNPAAKLFCCTSDDFFFFYGEAAIAPPIELAFIDGMHLAEFVYRDFINVERLMDPQGVIVVDDVLPNHPLQANRERQSQVWTGDVWRFAELIARKRPDLRLTVLDTSPSGLLAISRLSPENRSLWGDYCPVTRQLADEADAAVPKHVLARRDAVSPTAEQMRKAAGR